LQRLAQDAQHHVGDLGVSPQQLAPLEGLSCHLHQAARVGQISVLASHGVVKNNFRATPAQGSHSIKKSNVRGGLCVTRRHSVSNGRPEMAAVRRRRRRNQHRLEQKSPGNRMVSGAYAKRPQRDARSGEHMGFQLVTGLLGEEIDWPELLVVV